MSWIRVDTNLPRHRKTRHLMELLGEDEITVVGRLTVTWLAVCEVDADGVLTGYTTDDLDRIGRRKGFGAALVTARFVDVDEAGRLVSLHGWERNDQSKAAMRQRKHRERQREQRDAEGVTRNAPSRDVTSPSADVTSYVNTSRLVSLDLPKEDPSEGVQGEAAAPPLIDVPPEPSPDAATPERVLAAYVEVMTPAGWVRHSRLTPRLRSALAARIASPVEHQALAWWRALFERVAVRVTWPRVKTLESIVRSDDELQRFADGAKDDHGRPSAPPRDLALERDRERDRRLGRLLEASHEAAEVEAPDDVRTLRLRAPTHARASRAPPDGATELFERPWREEVPS